MKEESSPSAVPAHALYVELVTRISTQRLHYRSGNEETAVASLHSFFATTRKLMKEHPEAFEFQHAARVFLNDILRPYTARWHGWLTEDRENLGHDGKPLVRFRDEWLRRKFREELGELQPLLCGASEYLRALSLGEMVESDWLNPKKDSVAYTALQQECSRKLPQVSLGKPISLKIRPQVPLHGANKKGIDPSRKITCEIERAESSFIAKRRAAMGAETGEAVENAVGLALSGGGIRSATFCLGVVQTLHRHGIFNQVDYLSTVSGGGYLGTFLSSYLGTETPQEQPPEGAQGSTHECDSPGKSAQDRVDAVLGRGEDGLAEPAPVRHLRNNSKYLLNGGGWGMVRIAGVFITGFLASVLMLLTIPLLAAWAALGVKWVSKFALFKDIKLAETGLPALFEQPASPILAALFVASAIFWAAKLFSQRIAEGHSWNSRAARFRGFFENGFLILFVASVLAFGLCASYLFVDGYESIRNRLANLDFRYTPPEWLTGVLAILVPIAFGSLSKRKDGSPRKWAEALFYLTGPLFFLLAFLIFASQLGVGGNQLPTEFPMNWAWITVGLILWAFVCLNINTFAPHRYYRDRLCECYLAVQGKPQRTLAERGLDSILHGGCVDRTEAATSVGAVKSLPLTSIGASPAAPYHLINAVLNAEAGKNPELRGRDGDFFLFSRYYCGCPLTGYITTETMQKANPGIDLGTAMAISGAAASTNMGSKTLKRMRFLMTLFNVRLGYWMRRPGRKSLDRAAMQRVKHKGFKPLLRPILKARRHPLARALRRVLDGPGPIYFLREMLGAVHERTRYVNLSDGGHIENLAAYELLRRQCKFIVCVDAGMEPGMECADLMRLQRLAEIDFGIRMHFDPGDLSLLPTRYSRAYAILVKIDYNPGGEKKEGRETSDQLGWMLYLKLAVTGTEPRHVLDYRRQNPDFPHQSTGDQLYDEAQFESYRSLGECAAESLFLEEFIGNAQVANNAGVDEWFKLLAASLLPDNDDSVVRKQT